jgi:hypothetical protein
MLYISRYINDKGYGIVDTDDNTEEFISYQDIKYYVEKLKIDIKGVEVPRRGAEKGKVSVITPYSYVADRATTKLKILQNVELTRYADSICKVCVLDSNDRVGSFVLSKYGSRVEDFAFILNSNAKSPVRVILDDNVEFSDRALQSLNGLSINYIFDLSNVTNTHTSELIYRFLLPRYMHMDFDIEKYGIIDSNLKRRDYYKVLRVIGDFTVQQSNGVAIDLHLTDIEDTYRRIYALWYQSFKDLLKVKFSLRSVGKDNSQALDYAKDFLRSYGEKSIMNDEYLANLKVVNSILGYAGIVINISVPDLHKLEGCLMVFGLRKELFDVYKDFVRKFWKFCKSL